MRPCSRRRRRRRLLRHVDDVGRGTRACTTRRSRRRRHCTPRRAQLSTTVSRPTRLPATQLSASAGLRLRRRRSRMPSDRDDPTPCHAWCRAGCCLSLEVPLLSVFVIDDSLCRPGHTPPTAASSSTPRRLWFLPALGMEGGPLAAAQPCRLGNAPRPAALAAMTTVPGRLRHFAAARTVASTQRRGPRRSHSGFLGVSRRHDRLTNSLGSQLLRLGRCPQPPRSRP